MLYVNINTIVESDFQIDCKVQADRLKLRQHDAAGLAAELDVINNSPCKCLLLRAQCHKNEFIVCLLRSEQCWKVCKREMLACSLAFNK